MAGKRGRPKGGKQVLSLSKARELGKIPTPEKKRVHSSARRATGRRTRELSENKLPNNLAYEDKKGLSQENKAIIDERNKNLNTPEANEFFVDKLDEDQRRLKEDSEIKQSTKQHYSKDKRMVPKKVMSEDGVIVEGVSEELKQRRDQAHADLNSKLVESEIDEELKRKSLTKKDIEHKLKRYEKQENGEEVTPQPTANTITTHNGTPNKGLPSELRRSVFKELNLNPLMDEYAYFRIIRSPGQKIRYGSRLAISPLKDVSLSKPNCHYTGQGIDEHYEGLLPIEKEQYEMTDSLLTPSSTLIISDSLRLSEIETCHLRFVLRHPQIKSPISTPHQTLGILPVYELFDKFAEQSEKASRVAVLKQLTFYWHQFTTSDNLLFATIHGDVIPDSKEQAELIIYDLLEDIKTKPLKEIRVFARAIKERNHLIARAFMKTLVEKNICVVNEDIVYLRNIASSRELINLGTDYIMAYNTLLDLSLIHI